MRECLYFLSHVGLLLWASMWQSHLFLHLGVSVSCVPSLVKDSFVFNCEVGLSVSLGVSVSLSMWEGCLRDKCGSVWCVRSVKFFRVFKVDSSSTLCSWGHFAIKCGSNDDAQFWYQFGQFYAVLHRQIHFEESKSWHLCFFCT